MRFVSKSSGQVLDEIRLSTLDVSCIIGVYPHEALQTQPLSLNVGLYLDTRAAGNSGRLELSVDYAALARDLRFVLTHARFRLLESAAEGLSSYILAQPAPDQGRAPIGAVALEIIKPEALDGRTIPSIQVFREASEVEADLELGKHVIFKSPEAAILRILLDPGQELFPSLSGWVIEAVQANSQDILYGEAPLRAGEFVRPGKEQSFSFRNVGEGTKSLLAVAQRERASHTSRHVNQHSPETVDLITH